jgi:hypothetical protein
VLEEGEFRIPAFKTTILQELPEQEPRAFLFLLLRNPLDNSRIDKIV